MPITLQEAKVGMADHVDQSVIDTFQRSSLLLDKLTFDNAISPGTGGSTLTYGYTQLKTPATAGVRAINAEYTANEAKREKKTASAVIMGGSFQVDRVLQNTSGAVDELAFQLEQKIKAVANEFHYLVINGKAAGGAGKPDGTFDGLAKMLSGTSNEIGSEVDVSTADLMTKNAQAFLDEVDYLLSQVDGPNMLMMNGKMLTKFRGIARRAGYYERTKDDAGRVIETYNGVPIVNLGKYFNGTTAVDAVADTAATASALGKSDIYAVSLGLDGFHGISPTGTGVVQSYMPDMAQPGAVKTGEVELVAGVVLKNTLKAGVLKGIGTAPKLG
ncbi:major capsid protein [Collinsella aerofaciens]|uniref:major capsid protein n=1 Tax=Collinsella aerofaciens TaxID=74426 RepID=UPI00319E98C3